MVEDLIITRTETIRLLQPDKLLEKLRENYNPPVVKERIRLKTPENNQSLLKLLSEKSKQLELPIIASGTSSVTRYTVMQRRDLLTVYCPKVKMLLERLPGSQSDRFPNLELLETEDEPVYFDARLEEWEYSLFLRDQYKNNPLSKKTGNLVSEYFSSLEGKGIIRLMESPYYRAELQYEEFMSALQEMFPLVFK